MSSTLLWSNLIAYSAQVLALMAVGALPNSRDKSSGVRSSQGYEDHAAFGSGRGNTREVGGRLMLTHHIQFRTNIRGSKMRKYVISCAVCIVAALLVSSQALGQEARELEFEVASIKPAVKPNIRTARQGTEIRIGTRIYGDRAEYRVMTLRQLIAEAYQVRLFQIVAPPGTLPRGPFDIVCKMPAGSRKEDAPLMLQSLLAGRFKLAVHREFREKDVWALVVGKDGPKFRESPSEALLNPGDTTGESPEKASPPVSKTKDGNEIVNITSGTTSLSYTLDIASMSLHYEASRMTMPYLAELMSRTSFSNGLPVMDMTELKSNYDVVYDLPMSALAPGVRAAGVSSTSGQDPRPAEAASDPGGGIGVLHAMRSLGLDLEKRKAQMEHLIIDHVEKKPTEN